MCFGDFVVALKTHLPPNTHAYKHTHTILQPCVLVSAQGVLRVFWVAQMSTKVQIKSNVEIIAKVALFHTQAPTHLFTCGGVRVCVCVRVCLMSLSFGLSHPREFVFISTLHFIGRSTTAATHLFPWLSIAICTTSPTQANRPRFRMYLSNLTSTLTCCQTICCLFKRSLWFNCLS